MSPELAGRFFTTSTTWEALDLQLCIFYFYGFFFVFFTCASWGILVPSPGIKPVVPAVEAGTTRKFPTMYFQWQLKGWLLGSEPSMASHLTHSKSQSFQRPMRPSPSLALPDLWPVLPLHPTPGSVHSQHPSLLSVLRCSGHIPTSGPSLEPSCLECSSLKYHLGWPLTAYGSFLKCHHVREAFPGYPIYNRESRPNTPCGPSLYWHWCSAVNITAVLFI